MKVLILIVAFIASGASVPLGPPAAEDGEFLLAKVPSLDNIADLKQLASREGAVLFLLLPGPDGTVDLSGKGLFGGRIVKLEELDNGEIVGQLKGQIAGGAKLILLFPDGQTIVIPDSTPPPVVSTTPDPNSLRDLAPPGGADLGVNGGNLCDSWTPSRTGSTYDFGYGVNNPDTGDIKCHREIRDGDWVEGVYSLIEPDGNLRTVTYYADKDVGFKATVKRTPGVAVPAPELPDRPWRVVLSEGSTK